MKTSDLILSAAVAGILSLAVSAPASAADGQGEKCYGVAKAGKNDCQSGGNSCAGHVTKDGQKDAFIYLPKGACEKIVGASLEPMMKKKM